MYVKENFPEVTTPPPPPSVTIMEALQESQKLQKSINEERNTYLGLAETGATLYFVIKALSKVNSMYRSELALILVISKTGTGTF